MTSVMHLLVDNYNEVLDSTKDPRVDQWLFMSSPTPIVSILIFYLYFVLKLGPKLMEKREPFQLQNVLIFYNAYQVVFSTWLCAKIFHNDALSALFPKSCSNIMLRNGDQINFSEGAWWYFFSKIVELLDTVFFVLRKKQNQVTFLHVYHHTIMALFTWVYLKYLPGEQGVFIGFLNSFVHIIMYSYYLIAALGPRFQKYLWWKKYMTWLQLTQFVLMLVYLVHTMSLDCGLPKALSFFFLGNVSIFMYLFVDFYRKAYNKRSVKKAAANRRVSNGSVQPSDSVQSNEKTEKAH